MSEVIMLKKKPKIKQQKKRVAAYCRVSTFYESQDSSYEMQMVYYNRLIQANPEWEMTEIYADHGISGATAKKRPGFQKMIQDSENGKIDLILTKSIKRFARNTVDLLEAIRYLKEINVEVFFEQENISTFSGDGDFMLTIMTSFAEEEIRSVSENVKWSVKKRFENGEPWRQMDCLGYHYDGEKYVVIPSQAKTVKRIFSECLNGNSLSSIAKRLNQDELKPLKGSLWNSTTVKQILSNISYTGNLLLQKTYHSDPFFKHYIHNKGERDQYFVPDTHQTLVSLEEWQKVQEILARNGNINTHERRGPLTGKVFSAEYDFPYWRHRSYWNGKDSVEKWKNGVTQSRTPEIPNWVLEQAVCRAMEVQEINVEICDRKLDRILVNLDSSIEVILKNGKQYHHQWRQPFEPGIDSKTQFSTQYKFRSSFPDAKRRGDLSCFVKCAECGDNYCTSGKTADGDKVFRLKCEHRFGKKFYESAMKKTIASVLGVREFDVNKMDEQLSYAVLDGNEVTFHFHNGRTERRSLHG